MDARAREYRPLPPLHRPSRFRRLRALGGVAATASGRRPVAGSLRRRHRSWLVGPRARPCRRKRRHRPLPARRPPAAISPGGRRSTPGDLHTAAEEYERALSADPDDAELRRQVFALLLASGEFDRALAAAQELVQADGSFDQAVLFVALDHARRGEDAQARDLLAKLGQDGLTGTVQPILLAWAQFGAGEHRPAIAALARPDTARRASTGCGPIIGRRCWASTAVRATGSTCLACGFPGSGHRSGTGDPHRRRLSDLAAGDRAAADEIVAAGPRRRARRPPARVAGAVPCAVGRGYRRRLTRPAQRHERRADRRRRGAVLAGRQCARPWSSPAPRVPDTAGWRDLAAHRAHRARPEQPGARRCRRSTGSRRDGPVRGRPDWPGRRALQDLKRDRRGSQAASGHGGRGPGPVRRSGGAGRPAARRGRFRRGGGRLHTGPSATARARPAQLAPALRARDLL